MIHRIFSSLPSFKEVRFKPGLNVILAERSAGATELQTRNRSGKSSLIELVHFALGANANKGSLCRTDALVDYSFGLEFDLKGATTVVRRSGSRPSRIQLYQHDARGWPVNPKLGPGGLGISNDDWRQVLASEVFGLDLDDPAVAARFSPTFRSLFSYFARRVRSGGFSDPKKNANLQQLWDEQVAVSFLIGIDWTLAQQWQTVRERERGLRALRKAAGEGTLGSMIGTPAVLRTQLAVLDSRLMPMRERVDHFEVLPEYREFEAEASELAREIGQLADANTLDRELLLQLEDSVKAETTPPETDLEQLYEEAGLVLPDAAIRRFDEVREFHASIIQNRQQYLAGEVDEARRRIAEREALQSTKDRRRLEIMGLLQTHGALDQFSALQGEVSKLQAETEAVRQRLSSAEQMEGAKTELDIERSQLFQRLQKNAREQRASRDAAIVAFQEASSALYEDAGSLIISESTNGPTFQVEIHGAQSRGISNMQVFCFDMMLMKLCAQREMGPGFLIHDSHLFDGVDSRQVAVALHFGAQASHSLDFQYIVTMNSDAVPDSFPDGFNINEHILPVTLSDATEDGGLFGFRFN